MFAPFASVISLACANRFDIPPTSGLFTITNIAMVMPTVMNRTCIRFAAATDWKPPTIV